MSSKDCTATVLEKIGKGIFIGLAAFIVTAIITALGWLLIGLLMLIVSNFGVFTGICVLVFVLCMLFGISESFL
jgi:hypothetical protein